MNRNFVNTLPPGKMLQDGKYIIIEVFGQGYFSATYLATQSLLNKRVIIHEFFLKEHCLRTRDGKVLNENLEEAIYKKFSDQWFSEAKILAMSSSNEHIATIMDTFEENGTIYYITEYINEEDLQSYTLAKKEHRLTENQALDFIFQVADGLSFLHQNAIIHLDLSPAKILIDKSEKAVIVSFGIARQNIPPEIVSETIQLTKPGYSPPEFYQPEGKYGTFSDIYSLGAILYFLVTGKDPVPAPERIARTLPEPRSLNPSITAKTNHAILKAMAYETSDRYQDIRELTKDLYSLKQSDPTPWFKVKKIWVPVFACVILLTVFLIFRKSIVEGFTFKKTIESVQVLNPRNQSTYCFYGGNKNIKIGTTLLCGTIPLGEEITDSVKTGKYYALLIGINDYEAANLHLDKPIEDVDRLSKTLDSKYLFNTIYILRNPTRKLIFQQFQQIVSLLKEEDNFLLFYAGHGKTDSKCEQGYWLPRDADLDNSANWISNNDLKAFIRSLKARHILIISDACFGGEIMSRRVVDDTIFKHFDQFTLQAFKKKSRVAISSSYKEEVPDRSVFLEWLIENLEVNDIAVLTDEDLYYKTYESMRKHETKKVPRPCLIPIKDVGHDEGSFVFIKRIGNQRTVEIVK